MKLNDYIFDASDYQDCISEVITHANKREVHSKETQMLLQASKFLSASEILCLKRLIYSYTTQVSEKDCQFCKRSVYRCKIFILQETL